MLLNSLKARIVLAAFAMTFVICILFSTGLLVAFEIAEDTVFEEHLESDMVTFMNQHAVLPEVASIPRDNFRVFVTESGDASGLPAYLRNLPEDDDEINLNGESLEFEIRQSNGLTYYFLIEEAAMDHFEEMLFISVLIIVILLCLISTVLGLIFANHVIRPVIRLADEVNNLESDVVPGKIMGSRSKDELDILKDAIDSFQARVNQLLSRERSFSTDASHELRTPLMGILSASENLQVQAQDQTRVLELAKRIENRCRHMRTLVDSLLVLARDPHSLDNDFQEVDMSEIISQQLETARPGIEDRNIQVEVIENVKPMVFSSDAILSVVFGNLLRNAILHSESRKIVIELNNTGFVIRDFGHGIPEDLRDNLFDRDVNGGSGSSKGYGIGLSLVKRLCSHFGWELSIDSGHGNGTAIRIDFKGSLQY